LVCGNFDSKLQVEGDGASCGNTHIILAFQWLIAILKPITCWSSCLAFVTKSNRRIWEFLGSSIIAKIAAKYDIKIMCPFLLQV
jgi:hypothetical protein